MSNQIATAYDALAAEYASRLFLELDNKPFDRAFLDRFVGSLPAGPILDVGCGPGHVGRYVHAKGRAVSGMDISREMIARAQQLNPDMQFYVGDMRSLPFRSGCFSGLVAFYSIIHLASAELTAVFKEMRRLLVPRGALALAFHAGREVRHVDELWGIKTSLDFVFFEPAAITASLDAAGFTIVEETSRRPYEATVEAQTTRCYVLAGTA